MRYSSRKVPRSPKASSEAVSKSMRANRAKNTIPEKLLRKAFRERGLKEYVLHPKITGRPDICFPCSKLAVFVHGCFWHRCPSCKPKLPSTHTAYWKTKFRLNKLRDRRKRRELEKAGWKVVEIWECEVKSNPKSCCDKVLSAVDKT